MAGQPITVIDVLPRIDSFVTVGPLNATTAADTVIPFPQVPRTNGISAFIEQITYSISVRASDANANFRLLRVPFAAGGYANVAAMVTAGLPITTAGATPATGSLGAATGTLETGRVYDVTVLTAENEIEPGDVVLLDTTGTLTNLAGLNMTIRYSTRRK